MFAATNTQTRYSPDTREASPHVSPAQPYGTIALHALPDGKPAAH